MRQARSPARWHTCKIAGLATKTMYFVPNCCCAIDETANFGFKHKNMKHILFIPVAFCLFISCKKNDDAAVTEPFVLSKTDFSLNYKASGAAYSFFKTNLSASPVAIPARGDNQSWDFSGLADTATLNFGGFLVPSNGSFPTATFSTTGSVSFSLGGLNTPEVPATYYYELADAGFYDLGYTLNSGTTLIIPSIGGTLAYSAQTVNYTGTTKLPYIHFPAKLNDSVVTTNINYASSYTANAAALGVVNTPGQTKFKITATNVIMASGTAKLKGIGNVRVLVNRHTETRQTNYFLGGAPTPTALLTQLGLTDGALSTTVVYEFYGEGLGVVAKLIANAAGTAVTEARFRKQ
jgi:hypothetical protein